MGPRWALSFLVAAGITVLGCLLLRGTAVEPSSRGTSWAKRLASVGVVGGLLAGRVLGADQGMEGIVIALGAAVFGALGLLADRGTVRPSTRLAVQLGMGGVAVAAGLRLSVTDVPALDVALSIVWIVGVTNGFALVGNVDALVSGVAAVSASCLFVLAILGGHHARAAMAAAVVGASLGFLPFRGAWTSTRRRDTGSSFFGFACAVLSMGAETTLVAPAAFVVPLLVMVVPLLETTVMLGRIRRRRRLTGAGRDHLPHRLVARGLRPGGAVGALVLAEIVMAALAVLSARRLGPWWLVAGIALSVLGALGVATARAHVHDDPVRGWPRWMRLGIAGAGGALLLASAPAALAMTRAETRARAAADSARRALELVGQGRQPEALVAFERSDASLESARKALGSPLVSLGVAVPGLSSNLRASRTLVSTSQRLARAGSRLTTVADASQLQVRNGTIPLDRVRRLAPQLADAERILGESRRRLRRVHRSYLLPPLQKAVRELTARVSREANSASIAADAARLAPGFLGDGRSRHYFLAFQNNAELRGTGGFIGNWGELSADGGRLSLTRSGRLADLIDGSSGRRCGCHAGEPADPMLA